MPDQPIDRSNFLLRMAALAYFVASVPLLSVSAVLPTIPVGEAIGIVVLVPAAVFAFMFIVLFVVQSFILLMVLALYVYLVTLCTFLGGQPVPQIVHIRLSKATSGWVSTIRHYGFSDRKQGLTYLTLVLVLSTVFVGLRLLEAFSDMGS